MKLNEAFDCYKKFVLSTPKQLSTEGGRWVNHIAPILGETRLEQIKNEVVST